MNLIFIKNINIKETIGASLLLLIITASLFLLLSFFVKSAEAQTFQEIVYEGRTYLVNSNIRAIGGSASVGRKEYSYINDTGLAVQREAAKRGLSYGFWTGCGFYFSDIGKKYVINELKTNSDSTDVCTNIAGIQTSLPSNYRFRDGGPGHCNPVDRCINVYGMQVTIPDRFIDVGGRLCQLNSDFHVFCKANKNPVKTNESLFFLAVPVNQSDGNISYTFRNVITGELIGTASSKDIKNTVTSFETEGIHQVSLRAVDSAGNVATSVCGITVSDSATMNGGSGSGGGIGSTTSSSTTSSTFKPLKVSLEGGGLTNNKCTIKWSSENANECHLMTLNYAKSKTIELSGEGPVGPGRYTLRCFQYEFSKIIQVVDSEMVTCYRNLDPREI